MAYDATAYLMGDPAASSRRSPTLAEMAGRKPTRAQREVLEAEMARPPRTHKWKRNMARCARLDAMKVNDTFSASGQNETCAVLNWFRRRGMRATCKMQVDRTNLITRVS